MEPLPPPFHGYPGPNHPAYTGPPTEPPGQLFRLPTSVPWFSPTTTNPRFIAPDPAPELPPN